MKYITWIEEYGALLLRNSCGVFNDCKACRSSGAVMVVHGDVEESASEVGVCGVDPEARAVAPRDL